MSAQRERVMSYSWLHDDTEEDIVGADWHQEAIRAAVISLRDLASSRRLPWHVGDQLTLVASRPDGTVWRSSPDIMVHPHAGPAKREEMTVSADGVPALIIEVASSTTWRHDVDTQTGKAFGYPYLGVSDYLVFDPLGALLGASCRGWQRQDGAVQEWQPQANGRYHTTVLDISFRPEGDLLRVFDSEGRPVAFYYEYAARVAELEAQLATLCGQTGREGA